MIGTIKTRNETMKKSFFSLLPVATFAIALMVLSAKSHALTDGFTDCSQTISNSRGSRIARIRVPLGTRVFFEGEMGQLMGEISYSKNLVVLNTTPGVLGIYLWLPNQKKWKLGRFMMQGGRACRVDENSRAFIEEAPWR